MPDQKPLPSGIHFLFLMSLSHLSFYSLYLNLSLAQSLPSPIMFGHASYCWLATREFCGSWSYPLSTAFFQKSLTAPLYL